MKILLTSIPVDEDIHEIRHRLPDVISEMAPDYIYIVAGEALSIHSHVISELHMFEYSNVRFATWNLIEDILYRMDELPEYYISVYPHTGVYRCKETGYRGIFKGVKHSIGYIQYEYTRKIFEKDLEGGITYILYSDTLDGTLFLWEIFRDFMAIDSILHDDVNLYIYKDGNFDINDLLYQPLYIGWRGIKTIDYLSLEEIGIIKLLAYIIDNGFLWIFRDADVRRKLLDRVGDVVSKLEYIYYSSTSSDREGYELIVTHEKDVGRLISASTKIIYFLEKLDRTQDNRREKLLSKPIEHIMGDILTQILIDIIENEYVLLRHIENSDLLEKFTKSFR